MRSLAQPCPRSSTSRSNCSSPVSSSQSPANAPSSSCSGAASSAAARFSSAARIAAVLDDTRRCMRSTRKPTAGRFSRTRPPIPLTHVFGHGVVELSLDRPIAVPNDLHGRRARHEQRPSGAVDRRALLGTSDQLLDPVPRERSAAEETRRRAGRRSAESRRTFRSAASPTAAGRSGPSSASSRASRWRATSSLEPATWCASSKMTRSHPAATIASTRRRLYSATCSSAPACSCADRLDGVERAHDLRKGTPGVDAGVDRHALRTDEHELLTEAVGELRDPLELHALRSDDENPWTHGRVP